MPLPALIRIGDEVFEVVATSPAGSVFLLATMGLQRQRIAHLEQQLASERAELARLEREAVDVTTTIPEPQRAEPATIDSPRTHPHAPQEDATGTP